MAIGEAGAGRKIGVNDGWARQEGQRNESIQNAMTSRCLIDFSRYIVGGNFNRSIMYLPIAN